MPMTTSVDDSTVGALSAFVSEHELSERWRVTLRTVQRRVAAAELEPVGLVGRAPHFYREAVDVADAIVVIEDVEEAGVDDGVEALFPLIEGEGVFLKEVDGELAVGGFLPGAAQRLLEKIDAGDFVASGGEEDGGVAGAATGIEHRRLGEIGCGGDGRLRAADVPGGGGRRRIHVMEAGLVGKGAH